MSNQATIKELQQLLANIYALALKTQNYHWHVTGPHFKQLHELFDEQYSSLASEVDEVAERIIILGGQAPATYKALGALTNINDGDSNLTWQAMVSDLASDQDKIVESLTNVLRAAEQAKDEGTIDFASSKFSYYEKQRWFLEAHIA